MSGYADVDKVIKRWVKATRSTLYTTCAGAPRRAFHIPGDPPFECFQVSIGEPVDGKTTVSAWAIDTNDDTDDQMEQTWAGAVEELDGMIEAAVATIEKWKRRVRLRSGPPSPW